MLFKRSLNRESFNFFIPNATDTHNLIILGVFSPPKNPLRP